MSNKKEMAELIAELMRRPLTEEEHRAIRSIEEAHSYSPDDPMYSLVCFLGAHRLLAEELPTRLEVACGKIIDLHRSVLEAQAGVIAKNLLVTVGAMLPKKSWKERAVELAVTASVSIVVVLVVLKYLVK